MALNIGLVGYGYWGPMLARNFNASSECNLAGIAEIDNDRLAMAARDYPACKVTSDFRSLAESADIDVIVIATPVATHFDIAMIALDNNKHLWVEKPIAASSEMAQRIADKADSKNLIVMTDHTFLFSGAVMKIKEIIDEGSLGNLFYIDSVRANLGLFQHDVNVLWDLGTHDLSIVNHLTGLAPKAVSAIGAAHFNGKLIDVGYLTLWYENNLIAHLHANWLSPLKIRKMIFGGSKNMLVWDDNERDEKVKIYNKGVDIVAQGGEYTGFADYRVGDVHSPVLLSGEALRREVDYFAECVNNSVKPHNDARAGLEIVKILEASNRSLQLNGTPIELK